jgi:carbonic anhydrase
MHACFCRATSPAAHPLSRRLLLAGLGALACTGIAPARAAGPVAPTSLTSDAVLGRLQDGNRRFLAGEAPQTAALSAGRRGEVAIGQAPIASILTCADSRVAPELLFSMGLGELFVARNAGNTADTAAIGSLEYAVAVLGTPLVMVLGHERCGAVEAALAMATGGPDLPGRIGDMVEPILPAALASLSAPPDQRLDIAVRGNARRVAARLTGSSPLIGARVQEGKVRVVAAHYDLDTGEVEILA